MGKPLTNPVTKFLRRRGQTLKYYAQKKGWSYGVLKQVITGYRNSAKIIKGLREDGLYELLPKKVRERLDNSSKEEES